MSIAATTESTKCFHCGEDCEPGRITAGDKQFCCEGCKMVYQLLDSQGLCDYYNLNEGPGITRRITVRKDKFAFLDQEDIKQQLISFANDKETHVTLYLPHIHCSSCLYLLENLHKLNPGIVSSRVNFSRKEVSIVFHQKEITLRQVAELLTSIGYEPFISLNDLKNAKPRVSKSLIYRMGVAGFCFGNSMLFSFPEYLGLESAEMHLQSAFRLLNLLVALPAFFYSSWPFFHSGWQGLRSKFLNIDAPIALAILVTFVRSVYEVASGTGAGYFDSMTGIVFFMLVGRVLQEKTYQQLSFDRDFTAYFPVAVTVLKNGEEIQTALPSIKPGDTILIHNEELVPADSILTRGKAFIDYSFVTGESTPVEKSMGEIVYAGGKQTGGNIELLVMKEVAQSYLTGLWSKDEFKKASEKKKFSFVHLLSRYFTYIVLTIATTAAIFWYFNDPTKIWPSVTAVLIIACPCALLLSNTFTNGNILRILGRNKLYLRNAQVIEEIANANHIVFDKTGTLTSSRQQEVTYHGEPLDVSQIQAIITLAAQSTHPLSKALVKYFGKKNYSTVDAFHEIPGRGVAGMVDDKLIRLGSQEFVTGKPGKVSAMPVVYVSIDNKVYGHFTIQNFYRKEVPELVRSLSNKYKLSVISGDNAAERNHLQQLLGENATVLFRQSPEDKLHYIQQLQQSGEKVIMIGDGLNDAGALKQSDTGIAITEDSNNFTPASDAILEAGQLPKLQHFIQVCKANKQIVMASFMLSIAYNIVGVFFAVQGNLSPLVAAILMPSSSLSILLITFGCSNLVAKWKKL